MDEKMIKKEIKVNKPLDTKDLHHEQIDSILTSEIAALEAYKRVSKKVNDMNRELRLHQCQNDHQNAIKFWKAQAKKINRIPTQETDLWGKMADAFVSISSLIGERPALAALKQGEIHGLHSYEKLLTNENLNSEQRSAIKKIYIPQQHKHITEINNLLKSS